MPKIEIYTKSYCPYCTRAKELLCIKGVDFTEYDVTDDPTGQADAQRRSSSHTVPQIFIDGQSLGGCSELFTLDEKGELSHLLQLND